MIGGKAEKSRGSELLRPTMMISSASRILNVKKISNIIGGMGRTSMASTISTTAGIASEDQEIFPANCRRSDTVKDATAITALKSVVKWGGYCLKPLRSIRLCMNRA